MRLEYGQFVTIGNNNRCMKIIFRKGVKIPKRGWRVSDGINVAACPERRIDFFFKCERGEIFVQVTTTRLKAADDLNIRG
jgi:hypothetical protein